MSVLSAPQDPPGKDDAAASSRAMAWMGGVFAFTALAALAVALVLEGPAADAVVPGTAAAAAAAAVPAPPPR